jgi:hypothetical protein
MRLLIISVALVLLRVLLGGVLLTMFAGQTVSGGIWEPLLWLAIPDFLCFALGAAIAAVFFRNEKMFPSSIIVAVCATVLFFVWNLLTSSISVSSGVGLLAASTPYMGSFVGVILGWSATAAVSSVFRKKQQAR